jgi:hypothetical protein
MVISTADANDGVIVAVIVDHLFSLLPKSGEGTVFLFPKFGRRVGDAGQWRSSLF